MEAACRFKKPDHVTKNMISREPALVVITQVLEERENRKAPSSDICLREFPMIALTARRLSTP